MGVGAHGAAIGGTAEGLIFGDQSTRQLSQYAVGYGSGMQIAAQKGQALAENAALKWNAAIAERDAELLDLRADRAEKIGHNEAKELRSTYNTLRGEQRGGYAAGGVDVNYGSAAKNQANTVAWGEYEAQKAIYNSSMTAWEYRVEATNKRFDALSFESQQSRPNMAAYIIGGISNFYKNTMAIGS